MDTRQRRSRSTTKMQRLALLSLSILAVASAADYDDGLILKQVHVVTRHGSRHALPKGSDGLTADDEKEYSAQLTAFGRKQMYDLGDWLHQTYYSVNQDAQINFESSPYDRTISSANSLALGLLNISADTISSTPIPSEIFTGLPPVFMDNEDSDVYIRAYDKCPTFGKNLQTLYGSAQWTTLQEDSMELLQKLATIEEFKQYSISEEGKTNYIPLAHIWNIYDTVHVAKTECAASKTLGPEYFKNELVPLQHMGNTCHEAIEDWIANEEWVKLEQLAHTVELLKYNGGPHQKDPDANTQAGKLIGSNLLSRIMLRMLHNSMPTVPTGTSADATATAPDLYVYSAHYPTILGMFAALQEPFFVDTNLSDDSNLQSDQLVLPNYASALILEYFQDTKATSTHSQWLVRVRFKNDKVSGANATSTSQAMVVPLKTACTQQQSSPTIIHESTEYCPVNTMSDALWEVLHEGEEDSAPAWEDMTKDWCRACGNEKATPCMEMLLQQARGGEVSDDGAGSGFWNGDAAPTPSSSSGSSSSSGRDPPRKSSSSSSSASTQGSCSSDLGRPVLTGILIGLAMAVAMVGLVWIVLWYKQRQEENETTKAVSVMKETHLGGGGGGGGGISAIMQETVGDDTHIEEAPDQENSMAMAPAVEEDDEQPLKETLKAENADMA